MRTNTGKEASSSDSIGLQGLEAMLSGKCCSSDLFLLFKAVFFVLVVLNLFIY